MSQETEQFVALTFSLPLSLKTKIEARAAAEDRPVSSFLRVKLGEIVDERHDAPQPSATTEATK